jgi:hypothetical protein
MGYKVCFSLPFFFFGILLAQRNAIESYINILHQMFVGISIQLWQQFTGINAIMLDPTLL